MDLNEFKRVYNKEGSKNLSAQIPYLEKLAEQYEDKARENPRHKWTETLKAHALYNSCAARCTDTTENEHYTKKAFKVQNHYLKYTTGQEIALDKLDKLRVSHLTQIQDIRKRASESIKPVAELISKFRLEPQLIDLPHNDQVISDCVDAIIEYFETLAMTVYFLIGNLQETKLKYMAIDELSGWFTDEAKNGFKIDGLQQKAGNIPTGNGSSNPKNKFICTVNELLDNYQSVFDNPPGEQDDVTGDDSDLLAFIRSIYSTSYPPGALTHSFRKKKTGIKPNSKRLTAIAKMTHKDLETYKPSLFDLVTTKTQIFAKTNVYRYTSLLVLNLGIWLGETTWNSLTTIDQLFIDDQINELDAKSLKTALLVAMYIRLSCYLHYNSQKEEILSLENIPLMDVYFLPKAMFIIYISSIQHVQNCLGGCLGDQVGKRLIVHVPSTVRYCEAALSIACNIRNYAETKT